MTNLPTTCTKCGFANMNIVGWLFLGEQRLCPKCRSNMSCCYSDHAIVKCEGPVVLTFHDARGCFDVCFAHAKWRMTISMVHGHSSNCPKGK